MTYNLALPLKPYQSEGVAFALAHRYVIIADEMGLGKTPQGIAVIAEAISKGGYAIVVCPSFLKGNWENEFRKFTPEITVKVCSTRNGFQREGNQVCIVSYSQLQRSTHLFFNSIAVVGDEIHYLKTIGVQRTYWFHQLIKYTNPTYFAGLSGTPIKNRVGEYYSLLCLCGYTKSDSNGKRIEASYSYWEFCNTFSNRTYTKVGNKKFQKFKGTKNIPLLKSFLDKKYIRRLAKDVLDLKEMIFKDVMIDYSKEDESLKEAWENHVLGKQGYNSTAKKDSALIKAKFTLEYIKNLYEVEGTPIVVFTDHPDVCHYIEEELKGAKIITGGTPVEKRIEITEAFQTGKIPYLILTIGSGSTGFNLTRANNLVFNDVSWVETDNAQARKRIHRIGQDKMCIYHRILGSKVDEKILKSVEEKIKTFEEVV